MTLYLIVIAISLIMIFISNAILSINGIIAVSVLYCLIASLFFFVLVVLVDAICVLCVRYNPYDSVYNPDKKIYKTFKWESKFYSKIKILSWKDKIPELGFLAGFVKTKVVSDDPSYLYKFAKETVYAEVMHIISALVGFVIILIPPYELMFNFAFPIALINFILNILPIFVQRYNRPRLLRMYYREIKRKKKGEIYE
jgi:glycosyl-4,4'-diaponeurosporenoate acyltransferase